MDARQAQEIIGGGYHIRRLLGRGGMSTVWLADDTSNGNLVAIKLLNQEFSDNQEFRQRFRNEASAARSVSSPNVVKIVTYEEGSAAHHGACYIVMEYIRGESLSQVLQRRHTLPEHLLLDVLEQTAHGLSAIHAANLIHRDIKPGNLLVTPEGTVKITDFGIAKAAEAVPLTRTGMVVGTAQYVSPEQAQGRQVTPATDIYSLGCVAYEMAAGSRPFQGDSTVAVAVAHINEAPPALAPTVNPHIRELIGIMLRKDPQRRYADGRELAQAVLRVRAGHRPPQPRGVTPTVHRQSNAANPATSELGAMTRPPAPAPAPTQAAQAPEPRTEKVPVQSTPRKKKRGNGCGSIILLVLIVALIGAIAVVYSLSNSGQQPSLPGDTSTSQTDTSTEEPTSQSDWTEDDSGWSDSETTRPSRPDRTDTTSEEPSSTATSTSSSSAPTTSEQPQQPSTMPGTDTGTETPPTGGDNSGGIPGINPGGGGQNSSGDSNAQ